MKAKVLKNVVAFLLCLCMLLSVFPIVNASNSYTINGVTVHWDDFSSSPSECWVYANNFYKKIWGYNFNNSFSDKDNSLRNLSDSELTLTIDHLRSYVSNATLGSVLRICNADYLHGSDGWGHSQLIVQKDSNGFTVFEGGLSAWPYCREKYYTWSEYINTGWLGGTYQYIKYIKWPGAPAIVGPSDNAVNLGDDFYAHIILEYPWLHVEATKDGNVQLAEGGNDSNDPRQIWHFVRDSNGSYEISNEYADLRLDAKNWGTENGTHIGVGEDNDQTAQRWFLFESDSACKIAASYKTEMVLDVTGGIKEPSTPIQLYKDNNTAAQKFAIYKLSLDGITYEKPSRPTPSSITSVSTNSGITTITWNASALNGRDDSREYDLRIWLGDASQVKWNEIYFVKYGITETSYRIALPDGKYTFCISTVNNRYQSWYTTGSYYEYTVKTICENHAFTYTVSIVPTLNSSGALLGTCSRCGSTTTVTLPMLSTTDYDYSVINAASCTAKGTGRYTWRTTDYGIFYFDVYVGALGHVWDNGVVTKQPTATESGVKTFTCTRCKTTRTERIPATGEQTEKPCDGGASCPSSKFADVNTKEWYHPYVDYAVTHGLFGGTSANTFEPETAMTRAMLVTVLWRYEGQPKGYQNTFSDVNAKNGGWYIDAVAWAAANGVVNGVGNGKFDPEGKITREQMAAILFRYAQKKGIDTSKRGDLSSFPDANKISGYAKEAVLWTVGEGIINGSDGKLLPQGNATRAQVATILMRYIENIVNG